MSLFCGKPKNYYPEEFEPVPAGRRNTKESRKNIQNKKRERSCVTNRRGYLEVRVTKEDVSDTRA